MIYANIGKYQSIKAMTPTQHHVWSLLPFSLRVKIRNGDAPFMSKEQLYKCREDYINV